MSKDVLCTNLCFVRVLQDRAFQSMALVIDQHGAPFRVTPKTWKLCSHGI